MSINSYKTVSAMSTGGGIKQALIMFGSGEWELKSATVGLGAYEIATLRLAFQPTLSDGTTIDQYLGSGYANGVHRPISFIDSPKILTGPGKLISIGVHTGTFEHELVVTYRRVIG